MSQKQIRYIDTQSGRSMVEMLGTLAIMGVLTIGGVAGYRYAINKSNANTILNTVSQMAIVASAELTTGGAIHLGEWSDSSGLAKIGGQYPVSAEYDAADSYFDLIVSGINDEVCERIKGMDWKVPYEIAYNGSVDGTCSAGENNEIDFAFAKTLNKNDVKVNGGSGDDTTPPEEDIVCDAGYYLDGTECQLCAAGTYAAAGANSCTTCPANTYSSAGAAACTDCPTGTTAPAGSTSAAACEGDPNCNTDPTKAIDEDHFCNAKCTSGCWGYGLNCYQLGKGSCPYLCKDGFCYTDCSDRGDYEVCDSGNVGKLEHCEYRDGWYNPLFVIDDDIYMYRTSTPHITACVCFTGDTLIQLANGTMKRADAVTYDDELLVWNFDEGHFDTAKPLWIKIPEMTTSYNYLKFSDGSILKTINHHRIFNREAGKFTYPMTDDTPIGTTTLNARGEWVTLVEQRVVEEEVTYYNIITEHHINCFAGNILTSCRLNNIYPIRDLKFVKDNRVLTPYTAFAELPKKWYDGLRLAEQPEEINRGKNDSIRGKNLIEYVQRLIERTQEPEQSVLAA